MDIRKEARLTKEGIARLINMVRSSLFPIEAQAAKVLFQVGQKPYGPMSRQNLESMVPYISRRKRWWNMVKQLDKSMVISDEMLVSCLLNLLGLSAQDTLMVLTSTGNKHELRQCQGRADLAARAHPPAKGTGIGVER